MVDDIGSGKTNGIRNTNDNLDVMKRSWSFCSFSCRSHWQKRLVAIILLVAGVPVPQVLTVANESYITATEVCEILRRISAEYAGRSVHLVLDNARYQKCAAVTELAGRLGIELNYVPPYSPNLNLIERLWKFVKGELRSKYYDDFSIFRQNIEFYI